MSPAENRHLAEIARNHLDQQRAENAFANETASAYAEIDARAQAQAQAKSRAKNTLSPRTDVITAEDGHLTGFAKRHGVTAMDVWHANKDKVPNPNAVQAGVSLNLPDKAQSTQARLDAAYAQIDRENKQRDQAIEREARQAEKEQLRQAERAQKAAAQEDVGATPGALPTQTVRVAKIDKLGDNAISAAQDRVVANGLLNVSALSVKSTQSLSLNQLSGQSVGSPLGATPAPARRGNGGADGFGSTAVGRPGGASGGISAGTLKTFANTEHHAAIDAARAAQRIAQRRTSVTSTTAPSDKLSFDRAGRLSHVNGTQVKENQTNKALNKNGTYSFDKDGNGAGDAGGTVICTELYRQG